MGNLLKQKTTYNAYYGDFRGVDFSSDHTQVHKQRLAYAVNMYKDYQSGQGHALETIPGFRRRVELPDAPIVYGIHRYVERDESGAESTKILIHAGDKLYHWHNYPSSINVVIRENIILDKEIEINDTIKTFKTVLAQSAAEIRALTFTSGEPLLSYNYDPETKELTIFSSELQQGDTLFMSYVEGVIRSEDALFVGMNQRRSASFIFNNRLYLIDGKNYIFYDGKTVQNVLDVAYVPTTYINVIPSGENADIGAEYEQRNVLQPKFKHTFIADGSTTEFFMNENELEDICEVKVYGEIINDCEFDLANGKITFLEAPERPEDAGFTEYYAGIEITAKRTFTSVSGVTEERENIYELITDCSIYAIFDNRVFLSGNPNYPNHVFYCGRNATGYVDPTYFGVYSYIQDGTGMSPVTGMIPVADTLMVLKSDTEQDGSTFFHTAMETGENLNPVIYPSTQGLNGIGCLGACINFLDDPVFISRLGVEAVGQLSVRYERAIEHRSSLIDSKLVNLNLANAVLEEWNGYLVLLVDGKIFLADSRQKYTHDIGTPQYEWYYIENVGIHEGQYTEYKYYKQMPPELEGVKVRWCARCRKNTVNCDCEDDAGFVELPLEIANKVYDFDMDETKDLTDTIVNAPDEEGVSTKDVYSDIVEYVIDETSYYTLVDFAIHELYDGSTGDFVKYQAFMCDTRENKTGGVFKPAVTVKVLDSNLFFGTERGTVCSFNFDMRNAEGSIAPRYYNFDERIIVSGCATRMDNCDIPHMTKTTVKKSTVIKTKAMQTSAIKIRVRTNKNPYAQIARINSTLFSFDNMDFSDFSFITSEQSLFSVKEKEKKWVEKQYYIYTDEYMKPFAIFYLCYRYTVAGRYKE